MVALDEGWAKPAPRRGAGEEAQRLRPIACAEPLLKFPETLIIEEEIRDILKKLEPRQLGCGSPDAAPLVVRLMRTWADEITAHTTVSRQAVSMQSRLHPSEERD